ncbi:hypothetical protein NW762_011951 [Fusarium torreyae]|uniref:Rhodopsin domain-containing protein n=1 Tax=Fusarium torreyae TaxID=1237075 RepID=A0A9W8RSH9_9HYPO|nr:hypothetical protein NW762_011951 [Fusarium torreyae]
MAEINGTLVAVAPPEGYIVDFDNPARNSITGAYVVSGIGMSLALFFLLQRLFVKTFVGSIAIQALTLRSFVNGFMGVHAWEIPFDLFQDATFVRIRYLRPDTKIQLKPAFLQWANYINSIVYTVPTGLSKVVILLFLLEINSTQKWYRWAVFGTIFVVVGSSIGILIASIFPCTPLQKAWDLNFPADEGHCIDRPAMFQATAGLGVATDVVIIAIPVPTVLSLHLSTKKKAALLGLFVIGSA